MKATLEPTGNEMIQLTLVHESYVEALALVRWYEQTDVPPVYVLITDGSEFPQTLFEVNNGNITGAEILLKFDDGTTRSVEFENIQPGAGFKATQGGRFEFIGEAELVTRYDKKEKL